MIARVRKLELALKLARDEPGADVDAIEAALAVPTLSGRARKEELIADLEACYFEAESLELPITAYSLQVMIDRLRATIEV